MPAAALHIMPLGFLEVWDLRISEWAAQIGWPLEGLLRLVLAAVAGGLVGLEREVRGRQAGFRTNMLVCLGSALVMIVSTRFASHAWGHSPNVNITVDPARIAYGVMTGVGFLGAGTIIQHRGTIRGLTTAAGLWCVAAVGLSIGFGMYLLSAGATLLIVVALSAMDYFERLLPKARHRMVTLRTTYTADCIAEAVARFRKAGLNVRDASFERTRDLRDVDIHLQIAFMDAQQYYDLERQMGTDEKYQLVATREI
jgi:putative Mg2+ transporter-C (MgtC) family protein